MVNRRWEEDDTSPTWCNFVEEFRSKYIPAIVQKKKEIIFFTLEQGSMYVTQYEEKFVELARFSSYLVKCKQRKIRKFVRG